MKKKILIPILFTLITILSFAKMGAFNESTNPQDYLDESFYNLAGFSYGYKNPDNKVSLKNTSSLKANENAKGESQ